MALALAVCRGFSIHSSSKVRRYARLSPPQEENAPLPCAAAYVHLPFCKRRCHYCDFPIVALGSRQEFSTNAESSMERYVNLVCQEISSSQGFSPLRTVFFGGGTPSLISAKLLRKIIQALKTKHGFASGEPLEISMEMDPGTFNKDYLMQVVDCGVNRVSLGVQVFDDELLRLCGRSHCLKDVYEAIDWIKSCKDITNWSLDLISSLPHQSFKTWEHSLSEAVAAEPNHVSVYDLQIEQGTVFGSLYKPGTHPLPSDEESAKFYRLASSMLQAAGYDHYEISNYAKKSFQCRHNLVYWKNLSYYAYGLGSTSYVNGRRFTRSKKMREYAHYVETLAEQPQDAQQETVEDRVLDTVMLSLRLAEGMDLWSIEAQFGKTVRACLCEGLKEFVESGHAVFLDDSRQDTSLETAAHVRLTDPEGFLLSNEIISRLFSLVPEKAKAA